MTEGKKSLIEKTKEAVKSTALFVGDLNNDGKIDSEDARIAADLAKEVATSVGEEASRIGKEALRSDMMKDAAAGAAVGAVVSIPVPLIGPAGGAVVGASLGVYKYLTRKEASSLQKASPDLIEELNRLSELREKGVLNKEEFESQKRKILARM